MDCRYLIYNVKQQYAGLVLGWVTAKTKQSRVRVPGSLPPNLRFTNDLSPDPIGTQKLIIIGLIFSAVGSHSCDLPIVPKYSRCRNELLHKPAKHKPGEGEVIIWLLFRVPSV